MIALESLEECRSCSPFFDIRSELGVSIKLWNEAKLFGIRFERNRNSATFRKQSLFRNECSRNLSNFFLNLFSSSSVRIVVDGCRSESQGTRLACGYWARLYGLPSSITWVSLRLLRLFSRFRWSPVRTRRFESSREDMPTVGCSRIAWTSKLVVSKRISKMFANFPSKCLASWTRVRTNFDFDFSGSGNQENEFNCWNRNWF